MFQGKRINSISHPCMNLGRIAARRFSDWSRSSPLAQFAAGPSKENENRPVSRRSPVADSSELRFKHLRSQLPRKSASESECPPDQQATNQNSLDKHFLDLEPLTYPNPQNTR